MNIVRTEITPDMARIMLLNNPRNRPLNKKRVSTLVHDVRCGQWTDSPSPISLNDKGELLDGQHRLTAIAEANQALPLYVAYDVPDYAVFDKNIVRKRGEALYMRGLIDKRFSGNKVMAVVNRYLDICGMRGSSDTDKAAFINEYGNTVMDAITISMAGAAKSICNRAGCQVGIFAALRKGVDADVLYSFTKCVNTGFMDTASESAAIILRNYILEHPTAGSVAANTLAAYTQMCIRDYVENTPRRRKYSRPAHIYITGQGS